MYIGIYMWGRQDGVSEARVDMNAAALLQQTAPCSPPLWSLLAALTTFARLSFHYQSLPSASPPPPLSMVSLSICTVCTRMSKFFSKNVLLRSRAKAGGSITTQKPRRESRLCDRRVSIIFLNVWQ